MISAWVAAGFVAVMFAVGSLLGWLLSKKRPETRAVRPPKLDPELEHQMDLAAARWAAAHGRPEAAGLVASKLRLTWALLHRTSDGKPPAGGWPW